MTMTKLRYDYVGNGTKLHIITDIESRWVLCGKEPRVGIATQWPGNTAICKACLRRQRREEEKRRDE